MKLGMLTTCMPERPLEQVAEWAGGTATRRSSLPRFGRMSFERVADRGKMQSIHREQGQIPRLPSP